MEITIYPTGVFTVDRQTFQDAVDNYDEVKMMDVTSPDLGPSLSQAWNLGDNNTQIKGLNINVPTAKSLRNERGIRIRKSVKILGQGNVVLSGALLEIGGSAGQEDFFPGFFDDNVWPAFVFENLPATPPDVILDNLKFEEIGVALVLTSYNKVTISNCHFSKCNKTKLPGTFSFFPQASMACYIISNMDVFSSFSTPITIAENIPGYLRVPVRDKLVITHCTFDMTLAPNNLEKPTINHTGILLGGSDTDIEISNNTFTNVTELAFAINHQGKSFNTPDLEHSIKVHHNSFLRKENLEFDWPEGGLIRIEPNVFNTTIPSEIHHNLFVNKFNQSIPANQSISLYLAGEIHLHHNKIEEGSLPGSQSKPLVSVLIIPETNTTEGLMIHNNEIIGESVQGICVLNWYKENSSSVFDAPSPSIYDGIIINNNLSQWVGEGYHYIVSNVCCGLFLKTSEENNKIMTIPKDECATILNIPSSTILKSYYDNEETIENPII